MTKLYLKWGMIICLVLLVFAIGILLVGYKTITFGKIATMIVLAAGALGCGYLLRK